MGMQFQNLAQAPKWLNKYYEVSYAYLLSIISLGRVIIFKKELPILITIVYIDLLVGIYISASHQKSFILSSQFDRCISGQSLYVIKFFLFPILSIFLTHKILRLPFYNIIGSWSGRSAYHAVVIIQVYHFILHHERLSKAILLRNYGSVIFRNILSFLNRPRSVKSHTSSRDLRLLNLNFIELRVCKNGW